MICPFCKEEIADGAIKCKHCQSMIPQTPAAGASAVHGKINGIGWYFYALKQYAVFNGRAQRAQYWYFVLFSTIACATLLVLDNMLGTYNGRNGLGLLSTVYGLAVILPTVGVTIRRLHDINKSGWWYLIVLVPLVGAIVMLVFTVKDSQPGANRFGPNPKGVLA